MKMKAVRLPNPLVVDNGFVHVSIRGDLAFVRTSLFGVPTVTGEGSRALESPYESKDSRGYPRYSLIRLLREDGPSLDGLSK